VAKSQVARAGAAFPDLKASTRSQLMQGEQGSQYDIYDRLYAGYSADGDIFDYGDFTARDYTSMLKKDGQAAALESVLTLPLRQASYAITPSTDDRGEAEFARSVLMEPATGGGMKIPLGVIIGQITNAQIYKKSFFEKVFTIRPSDGRVVYDKMAYRPPATCELKRNARSGEADGFRQRVWQFGAEIKPVPGKVPGYVDIPQVRSYVFIHGKHREPLTGTSELELSLWCWRTKMKIIYLWLNFLGNQSLPKVVVYGQSPREAAAHAEDIASMRSSGIVGFQRPPAGEKTFELIESDGKGAEQFSQALSFLETWQMSSVLAGFTGLSALASLGRGSLALSQDQSSFFLKSRQAVSLEMCEDFTHGVIAPLIALNFGPGAAFPSFTSGPLTDDAQDQLVTLFQALAVAPSLRVPDGILDLITERLASVLNLDPDLVAEIVEQGARDREAQALAMAPDGMPKEAAAGLGRLAGGSAAAAALAQRAIAQSKGRPQAESLDTPFTPPPAALGAPK